MRLNTILAFMLGAALMASGSVLMATWPKFQNDLCVSNKQARLVDKLATARNFGWDRFYDLGLDQGIVGVKGHHKWLVDSGFKALSPACDDISIDDVGDYVCRYYGEDFILGSDAKLASYSDELHYWRATVRSNSGVYHLPPKPAEK